MELKDLIAGAQVAMDQGDYRLTIAASNHALVGYDACLAAHRLLGEAYLERGDQRTAVTHFERAIAIDPLNVVARLGLGVAAEETKQYSDAYAHYLHAWEINPALDQVRDELVRLRGLLNVEDRLHPTRAGLAGIHARCGQFARAATEWRAVLSVEPDSRRGRTALAELLWRQGDDTGAAAAARDALRGCPENARALAILADVEKRRGGSHLTDVSQRYVSVDPTGEVIEHLRQWRSDAEFDTLIPDSVLIDDFDFESNRSRQTGGLSRKSITGALAGSQIAAPDLWDTLVKDLSTDVPHRDAPTLATAVEPFSWAEGAPSDDSSADNAAITASSYDDLGDVFPTLADTVQDEVAAEQLATEPETEMPAAELDAPPDAPAADDPFAAVIPDPAELTVNGDGSAYQFDDIGLDIVPFSLDEVTGVVAPANTELDEAMLLSSFGTLSTPLSDPPAALLQETVLESSVPDYVDPFVSEDGRIDLTAGWDSLDKELEAATPSENGHGFDALVAELGVDGIIPFNADIESPDEDAWAPFSDVDFSATTPEEPAAELDTPGVELALPDATGPAIELADLEAFDVTSYVDPKPDDGLGHEIVAGIPMPQPSGYTELLRNIDEDPLPETDEDAEIDPFANPDATGSPLAFDELIEVTSTDGTGPLAGQLNEAALANELDFSSVDLAAAMPGIDVIDDDFGLDGVEPFDSSAIAGLDDAAESPEVAPEAFTDVAAELEPAALEPPLLSEFADLTPFAFTDADDDPGGASFDFTDMDGAPPAFAFEAPPVEQLAADSLVAELETEAAAIASEMVAVEDAGIDPDLVDEPDQGVELELVAELDFAPDAAESVESTADEQFAPVAAESSNGEVATAGRRVSWPQFMSQTSMLMDRALEGGNLFARIAAQKDALVEMGVVQSGRRLSALPPIQPSAPVAVEAPVSPAPVKRIEMNEQVRVDLMAMRVRLIEDDGSAREIAEMLEEAIDNGLHSPLALRVLGEAYLKLGMVERAAAQFRQAMLTRRGA